MGNIKKDGSLTEVVVHQFTIGDVDDPEIYAAQPLYEWEHSEQGQWVMSNSTEVPSWHLSYNYDTYGMVCRVKAKLTEENLVLFLLKWGNNYAGNRFI